MADIDTRVVRLEEQLMAFREARDLQAKEYARRLEVLNHAHEKADNMLHTYVVQAVYDEKHQALQNRLGALELWKSNIMGRILVVGTLGSLAVAIVTSLIVHSIH